MICLLCWQLHGWQPLKKKIKRLNFWKALFSKLLNFVSNGLFKLWEILILYDLLIKWLYIILVRRCTAQKMKFSSKDFFGKCDQICTILRIWSYLLKKSLMENFIFCAVMSNIYDEEFLQKQSMGSMKTFFTSSKSSQKLEPHSPNSVSFKVLPPLSYMRMSKIEVLKFFFKIKRLFSYIFCWYT